MDLLINFTVQERLQAESWSVLVLKAINTEHFRKKKELSQKFTQF